MACPLCESADTHAIQEYEVAPLVREWENNFHVDVREEFGSSEKFELCECATCGFLYFSPSAIAGSPALYSQLQRLSWYYVPHKWEHDVALQDLRGCRRALEVGCGTGDFVELAHSIAGLDIEGIELNESAVLHARKVGRPVQLMSLADLAGEDGEYDALCGFQVLEHVPDPADFLRASCALLRQGGKLLLGVPNVDSFLRYQRNLLDLPPHHMSRWSVRVLQRIPQIFPLRLTRLKTEPLAEYHVEAYLDAYLSRAERYGLPRYVRCSFVRNGLVRCLKITNARKLLRGQTLYVCYERI